MKLVPYIYTQGVSESGLTIHKISVFLTRGGTAIWQTDEVGPQSEEFLQEEYLLPNGLYSRSCSIDKIKDIAWVEIDVTKTNLADFYTWTEVLTNPKVAAAKPECWRSYYFFIDTDTNHWWTPRELSVEADIQDLGNASLLFNAIQASRS
jgi:hypothetical protein